MFVKMSSLWFILMSLCALMCGGLVRTDAVDDSYSGEVKAYLDYLKKNDTQYNGPVEKAYKKMNEFPNKPLDSRYAIAMINLYTQATNFYRTLNEEMRSGNPTEKWRIAGDLINRGLDILGPTLYKVTYRGCTRLDILPMKGSEYRFNQITSTTLDEKVATAFSEGCDSFLFIINDVLGVSVDRYSAFQGEKEVILKSTVVFLVTKGPIPEGKYQKYYLDGRGNGSGCDKAFNVKVKTISVLVVLIILFI